MLIEKNDIQTDKIKKNIHVISKNIVFLIQYSECRMFSTLQVNTAKILSIPVRWFVVTSSDYLLVNLLSSEIAIEVQILQKTWCVKNKLLIFINKSVILVDKNAKLINKDVKECHSNQ